MKLQRRITFHFFIQLVILFVFAFFFFLFLFFVVTNLLIREELDTNTVTGLVETIPTVSVIEDDEMELDKKWSKLMAENKMWMQVINQNGDVIYNEHVPKSLKQSYTLNELLRIEETRELGDYRIYTEYDSWFNGKYYFLFGIQDHDAHMLKEWFESYHHQGLADKNRLPGLEKKLQELDGYVQIYKKGELVQTIGTEHEENVRQLDIIDRIYEPGKYPTEVKVYNDSETDSSWLLYLPKKESRSLAWPFSKGTQMLLIAILTSLFFTVLISVWNGYRYGRPLLLFANWLERMGKGNYGEVFTEKEKKKVFKKQGNTRHRYRLYQEVFQSFYLMAEKLDHAEREREILERSRAEWMAGISHDLRTPLSSIQGYGHMLESSKYNFSAAELEEIGKVIRTKGEYMLQLVNDFSLVFQLKNRGVTLKKNTIEVNHFVQKAIGKFKEDYTLSAYSFEFFGFAEPLYITLDTKWFTRVLDNLMNNAIKHNPPNTDIVVRILGTDEAVNIQIEDNGIGMDEEAVQNLFNRYYRGTNTSEKTDGLGLGMSIAKAIVELHDGDIAVASEVGKGTSITIVLPLDDGLAKEGSTA